MCIDCHRELKKPGKGIGAGTRKWDIKIYAANGLMRAAAWQACWNDMERCDVEIHPWIPEEVRKTLERRAQEEQEADKRKQLYTVELQRQIQEAAAKTKILEEEANQKKRKEEAELQKSFEEAAAALQRSIEEKAAEKKRFEEDLQVKLDEAKEAVRLELEVKALAESDAVAQRLRALETAIKEQEKAEAEVSHQRLAADQIPLGTLLKNYILLLLSDKRNLVIISLVAAVAYLAMGMRAAQQSPLSTQMLELPTEVAASMPNAVTATMTATAYSTYTVTEFQTATAVPVLAVADPEIESEAEVEIVADEMVIESESEDTLSTTPAVDLFDVAEESTPLTEPQAEVYSSNQTPIEETVCASEPLFSAPLAHCAVSA
jgi:hypothetical protein